MSGADVFIGGNGAPLVVDISEFMLCALWSHI